MKFFATVYNTKLGKAFGKKAHIEAKDKAEAIKKFDSLLITLSSHSRDAFAYTNPEEE